MPKSIKKNAASTDAPDVWEFFRTDIQDMDYLTHNMARWQPCNPSCCQQINQNKPCIYSCTFNGAAVKFTQVEGDTDGHTRWYMRQFIKNREWQFEFLAVRPPLTVAMEVISVKLLDPDTLEVSAAYCISGRQVPITVEKTCTVAKLSKLAHDELWRQELATRATIVKFPEFSGVQPNTRITTMFQVQLPKKKEEIKKVKKVKNKHLKINLDKSVKVTKKST